MNIIVLIIIHWSHTHLIIINMTHILLAPGALQYTGHLSEFVSCIGISILPTVQVLIMITTILIYFGFISTLDNEDWTIRYMGFYVLMTIMLMTRLSIFMTSTLGLYISTKLSSIVTFVIIGIPSGFINILVHIPSVISEPWNIHHVIIMSHLLLLFSTLWMGWVMHKSSVLSLIDRLWPTSMSEFLWLLLKVFVIILGLSVLLDVYTYLHEFSDSIFSSLLITGDEVLLYPEGGIMGNDLPLTSVSSLIIGSSFTSPSVIKVIETPQNISVSHNMTFLSGVAPLSTLSTSSGESTRLGPVSQLGNQLIDTMVINQHKQFGHVLSLDNPTQGALESARMLSSMVYQLEHSTFGDDHKLLEYLVETSKNLVTYGCHFDLHASTLKPTHSYSVPLGRGHSFVDSAGVYALTINIDGVDHNYFGSAISLLKRLREHLSSLDGHKESTTMHHIINANGGARKLLWSPLITMPNLVKDWDVSHPLASISQGANNTLKGFAQHEVRLLETALIAKYSPELNGGPVVHFNFAVSVDDFSVPLDSTKQYRAICANTGDVLAESNSFQRLSSMLGKNNTTVSTYMNWKNPMNVKIAGVPELVFLREEGKPIITEPHGIMLNAKQMYPLLTIGDKSLYDLEVGKLYAITPDWEIHGTYNSQAELWTALFPSGAPQPKGNSEGQTVGALTNLARLNKTEVGSFYYACNPLYPMGFSSGKPYFAINILSGVAMLHLAKSTCPYLTKSTVYRALRTGRVVEDTYRCIYKADLVKIIPRAMTEDTLTLTNQEVKSLSSIKGRK